MNEVFYFGSPIAKFSVSKETLDSVNEIADQVLYTISEQNKKDQTVKLFSSVNTEVNFPFVLLEDFSREILEMAKTFHQSFSVCSDKEISDYKISHMWMISQYDTEWGFLHSHTGSISGILYLKIPKDMTSSLPLDDKRRNLAGCISFAEGVPGIYRKSIKHFLPKDGDLYLFPSDLMHTIYPVFCGEERRSLSFNILVSSNPKV